MTSVQDLSPAPVYASACEKYALAGWPCVIPVPPEAKFPPPGGFTGGTGRDSEPADIVRWADERASDSIALRMPDGLIGIDVDEYVKHVTGPDGEPREVVKRGAQTVARAEAELGPLPPTWTSTARGDGPSRIRFYRVPAGRYASVLGPDVEIIQRHHRYAVVAPSPHYEIGSAYAWYAPDGTPAPGMVPGPGDMTELPPGWVAYLAGGAAAASPVPAAREDGMALLEHVIRDDEAACVDMARALGAAATACSAAEAGSRHDQMTEHVYELVMLAAESHPGVGDALDGLSQLWGQLTAGEDRAAEFHDMLLTAARKAATIHGTTPHRQDPCMGIHARVYAAPAPAGPAGEDAGPLVPPVEPDRNWSPYEAVGTEPFDPPAELDGPLARDVLGRCWPVLRYAPDAGTWLIRGPDFWRTRKGDMAKWGVDLVSWLMLPGDAAADKDSPEARQARKRARFCTSAASNGIAGKMNAQVAAGHHTSTVELADLDSEREILWAGGVPYDLRLSREHPEPSRTLDPGVPHLHSAGVVPVAGAAPLWDAFTAAVWPDAELRAWALRVLAVAFTGYPDKALPILSGETDAGKTQVIMLLMSVLGSYAHVADARLLAAADKSHASIVYALKGRRLSFIDEAPRTGQQATERLKQITGGAELTGNQMHENPVTFSPTHTLILTANPEHEPVLTDAAIRRRLRLIPCGGAPAAVRAARAAIGTENSPAWRREAPAVLAKMMSEAAGWLADQMSGSNEAAPDSARAAAEAIRESQDVIAAWVNEDCEYWERGTKARDLFAMFTERCRSMAMHPSAIPSETRFGRRLTELGYPPAKRENANYRQLRVRPLHTLQPTPAEFMGTSGGAYRPGTAATRNPGGFLEGSKPTLQDSPNGKTQGQTIQPTIQLEGMEGLEGRGNSITYTHTHTRTHEKVETTLQPSRPSRNAPAGLLADSPAEAEADPVSSQSVVTESGQTPAEETPAKPARKRAAPKLKPEKVRPDPALEGPVHLLPVIVARDPGGGPPLVLPCSPDDARMAAEPALEHLHVDCETTGYPPGHPDYALRLVQLGDEQMAAVLDPDDPAQAAVIRDLVSRAQVLHAHSAAADLVPLAWEGLGDAASMWGRMEDSVLIAKLADPAMATSDQNALKKLAADLLRDYAVSPPAEKAKNALFKSGGWLMETTPLTPPEKSGWGMVRKGCETFARYAGSDVLDLGAVLRVLPRPDKAVLARERKFQAMCARVAHDGFRLDPAHIRAKIAEYELAQEAALQRVQALCPDITNPSSTTEVPAALAALGVPLGRTQAGNLSAAKGELERLAKAPGYEHAELLGQILEYRHDVTTLGLLLRPLNVLCERGDGRMRPVVYTINADTGRTSCVRPNGQQFSRQGGIRACVTADEGMLGISADFEGVEIRVGAALSGDMDLLAAELSTRCLACAHDPCACGKGQTGLHWMAARMAFGPDATKEDRYNSKRLIFSKMFGGGPESGARQVGVSPADAQAVHTAFEVIAPVFTAWDQQMRSWVRAGNRGFGAYSGRTIWLPPKHRPHAAGNYAIQGTAREFLVDGCLRWEQTRWGHLPLLPIHDEVLTWVPAGEVHEARAALVECMRGELFGVPIEAKADEPFLAWPDSS